MHSLFNTRQRRPAISVPVPVTIPAAVPIPAGTVAPSTALQRLVAATRFELVPVATVDAAIGQLPPASAVTVTCLPARGLGATLDLTARLLDAGHHAVPHLAARLVEDRAHVARIAVWIRSKGLQEIFVVGGDERVPTGRYADGSAFLGDLFEHDTGLRRVGVPAYPDGHPFIAHEVLRAALHAKQTLIAAAGLDGWATTQMCFDGPRVRRWLCADRAAGLWLPIELGVPGVVDRKKLMAMGVRLGIGSSLRFLRKQRATMTAMLAPGGYDPTDIVTALAADADELQITGLHTFTFNSVGATEAWRRSLVGDAVGLKSRPSEPM